MKTKLSNEVFLLVLAIFVAGFSFADTRAYNFVCRWGNDFTPNGQFDYPASISVDSAGYVYVADVNNNRIQKFSPEGVFVAKWTGLYKPYFITIDKAGNVYAVESKNFYDTKSEKCLIRKFTCDGEVAEKIEDKDSTVIAGISDMVVDDSGNIYALKSDGNAVYKLGADGGFIAKWGGNNLDNGRFHWPSDVAVDDSGNIYVADRWNGRIQKFSADGMFIKSWWRESRNERTHWNPDNVGIDNKGNVYVLSFEDVQKYSPNGEFICKWGEPSNKEEGYTELSLQGRKNMTVDDSGNVYILDGDRILKFDSNGAFVTKWDNDLLKRDMPYAKGSIAVDSAGCVYIFDDNRILQKYSADGQLINRRRIISTHILLSPKKIAVDNTGNIYLSAGNLIFRISNDSNAASLFTDCNDTNINITGLKTGRNGNIYTTNSDNTVKAFNSDGLLITKIGTSDREGGQFNFSRNIEIDGSGHIYVADNNNRIQKFSPDGKLLEKWDTFAYKQPENRHTQGLNIDKLKVDNQGNMLIYDGNGLLKFDSKCVFLSRFADAFFNKRSEFPVAFMVKGITMDTSGNVYMAIERNVYKFNAQGELLLEWGSDVKSDGKFKDLRGIVVDTSGNVYALDGNRIQKFGTDGDFKIKWECGGDVGRFSMYYSPPRGIATDASGCIYVLDDNEIRKYFPNGALAQKWTVHNELPFV